MQNLVQVGVPDILLLKEKRYLDVFSRTANT
jgi:hypothetical protein